VGPAPAGPVCVAVTFEGDALVRGMRLLVGDEGATAIEYAVLASGIAAVIVVVVYAIGTKNYQYFLRFEELFTALL